MDINRCEAHITIRPMSHPLVFITYCGPFLNSPLLERGALTETKDHEELVRVKVVLQTVSGNQCVLAHVFHVFLWVFSACRESFMLGFISLLWLQVVKY